MIQVTVSLVDFIDTKPINNAEVTVIVQVVPRWSEVISPDLESDRTHRSVALGRPVTILLPRTDLAEEFQQRGLSNANGFFQSSFNVADAFRRLRQLIEDRSRPYDVVAFITIRIACAGLERTVKFGSLSSEQGVHLLGENANIHPVVVIDFAKAIVGHTTENSTMLWFNLHGTIHPSDRYVCQVQQISPQPSASNTPRTFPVVFDSTRTNTAIVPVDALQPATTYTYTLLLQDRLLTRGQFTTAPSVNPDRFSFVFGSCHLPTKSAESLERWQALARRDNYDFMLLIGDQIYGDEIEYMGLGNTWFERYVNRYHQLWTYQPMRNVLRNTPTYMVLDDHEVVDDWGVVPIPDQERNLTEERVDAAKRAYRIFQQAHNPGGYNGNIHYSFRWGPASFFVMDNRSARRVPPHNQEFPILGRQQWEAIQAWAREPATLASDIIFFIAPVPIAFLPVEEVRRLIDELQDEAKDLGILAGFLSGAALGGLFGGIAGAVLGGYAGHEVAESKIEEAGLADLTTRDLADMWTYEPNQKDLTRVLDCLFNLANDIQSDGRPGSRPRAVFVLGGDVHSGSMHVIRSESPDNRHRRNPLIYQVTSSAISHPPVNDQIYEQVVRHIQDGQTINGLDLVRAGFDEEQLVQDVVEGKPAKFVLDSKQEKKYAAQFSDLLVGRNFGQIIIERARRDRRVYHFYLFVEGQHQSIQRAFELDLDATQKIEPKELFGVLLATEGKVTFLRVHDVGTGYGASNDYLDVEVVIQLDTEANRAFGFQLRNDVNKKTHSQMLNVLRDAFKRERRIRIDYIRTGLRNGRILRVAEPNLS